MGSFDRFYDQPREYVAFESAPLRPKERVMRLAQASAPLLISGEAMVQR